MSWPRLREALILTALLLSGLLLSLLLLSGLNLVQGLINQRMVRQRDLDQPSAAASPTYYVSLAGDDDNAGTSPQTAWRSIDKLNRRSFAPGSRILFAGGQTFIGGLRFDRDDVGTPARPIVIGSYGEGRATIDAVNGDGISVHNTGGFQIERIAVTGAGRTSNSGSGIIFANDLVGDVKLRLVRIDQVELTGFGQHGLLIDGASGKSGYRDVRLTNIAAHDNALSGITVAGEFKRSAHGYAHEQVYIGAARVYNNPGVPGADRQHSGSGIVVSDVDGGVIERSTAFNNGALCEAEEGGPVGIWAWDANNITIQFNESYGNGVAGPKDGGGFDLDGGVTNSVMQYNYAHDNDGAGYLLAQFPYARPFGGNTVRYNISANDGRKNRYGGLHFWGPVVDTQVYNNTIYVAPAPTGQPAAVVFDPERTTTRNIALRNNILETSDGLPLIEVPSEQPGLLLQGNAYFSAGAPLTIDWLGAEYASLSAWRSATGQEQIGGRAVGLSVDPQLRDPAASPALGDAALLATLDSYRLRPTSPLIGAGLDLRREFGIAPGDRDYYGNGLPQGAAFEIGAYETK
jgi:hypothetical protein